MLVFIKVPFLEQDKEKDLEVREIIRYQVWIRD